MPRSSSGRPPAGEPALTHEIRLEICERIACGESLRTICLDDHMPHRSVVRYWRIHDPEFSAMIAAAREEQGDAMDEKILETADAATPETANADRVKIDAYKWRAERLKPKTYGTRQTIDVNHGLTDMSDDELLKQAAALAAKLGLKACG